MVSDALARQLGILRSLAIYYGIPGRARRLRRFYRPFVTPGALCFDIGAHVGNRTAVWRRLGARVVAVEPQPSLVRWLEFLHGRDEGVTIVRQAVGARTGQATLYLSRLNPTVATLSTSWRDAVSNDPAFTGVRWDETVPVAVTTLDALIAAHGRPDFCKLDIEGHELEALKGLSVPIAVISFEYIPAAIELAAGCIARLGQLGYYTYNWFEGESHRWALAEWLDGDAMMQKLAGLARSGRSGDIIAQHTAHGSRTERIGD